VRSGLLHGLAEIVIGSDVVAIENGTRSVATDSHRDTFTNAGADHVAKPDSPAQARDLVRRQSDRKPDLIKLWWVRRQGDNLNEQVQIMTAAIEESKSHNVRVAIHATELETAKAAVRAGAAS